MERRRLNWTKPTGSNPEIEGSNPSASAKKVLSMFPSSNGSGHLVFAQEIAGSNPVGNTKVSREKDSLRVERCYRYCVSIV